MITACSNLYSNNFTIYIFAISGVINITITTKTLQNSDYGKGSSLDQDIGWKDTLIKPLLVEVGPQSNIYLNLYLFQHYSQQLKYRVNLIAHCQKNERRKGSIKYTMDFHSIIKNAILSLATKWIELRALLCAK